MSELGGFIHDVYASGKSRFMRGLALTAASGLAGGLGILLIVPLLALAGLGVSSPGVLGRLAGIFSSMESGFRLAAVLGAYILILSAQALVDRASYLVETEISSEFSSRTRQAYFRALLLARWDAQATRSRSDTGNSISVEAARFGAAAGQLVRLGSLVFQAGIQVIAAALLAPTATLFVAILGLGYLALTNSASARAAKAGRSILERNRALHREVVQRGEGLKETKIYGVESASLGAFSEACSRLKRSVLDFAKAHTLPALASKIGASLLVGIFLFFSVRFAKLSIDALLLVIYAFARIWPLFSSFRSGYQQLASTLPSYAVHKRDIESLQRDKDEGTISGGARLGDGNPPLRLEKGLGFKAVRYTWPGRSEPALRDLDLELERGTLTVLRGPSGSGKSTLTDLAAGLIQPDSGSILVDGLELDANSLARWRTSVAYVPQHPYLFDGTAAENLGRYNPGADRKAMETCLRMAKADFILALPGGLDARIGDGGAALSGGERQRLVLARALLKRSEFLILDEATNALDEENHEAVLQAISALRGEKTILLISHGSFDSTGFADRILRMEAGRIVV